MLQCAVSGSATSRREDRRRTNPRPDGRGYCRSLRGPWDWRQCRACCRPPFSGRRHVLRFASPASLPASRPPRGDRACRRCPGVSAAGYRHCRSCPRFAVPFVPPVTDPEVRGAAIMPWRARRGVAGTLRSARTPQPRWVPPRSLERSAPYRTDVREPSDPPR